MTNTDLTKMTSQEIEQLLERKRAEERKTAQNRRETYESLRADFATDIHKDLKLAMSAMLNFHRLVTTETAAFFDIMKEYGALRNDEQRSYTIQHEGFKIEVKSNKIKRFDERADIAATRLIEFLRAWIKDRKQGEDDPMYQLAMTLLERNKYGDLDYKSISKLYDLETKFNDSEYTAIMQLFKESNIVESSATNFYFYERDEHGVWRKLEPSFNRM